MPFGGALILGGLAAAGAIGGAVAGATDDVREETSNSSTNFANNSATNQTQKSNSVSNTSQSQNQSESQATSQLQNLLNQIQSLTQSRQSLELAPQSALESFLSSGLLGQYQGLQNSLNQAGDPRVGINTAGMLQGDLQGLARQLASLQGDVGRGPTAQDMAQGQAFAASSFAPQLQALQQQFGQQEIGLNRQLAAMGRGPTDPILRAKLAESQGNAMAQLAAQQSAAAGQAGLGLFQNRISGMQGLLGQRAQMMQSGAQGVMDANQQALLNRFSLLGQGFQGLGGQQGFRTQTAARVGTETGSQTQNQTQQTTTETIAKLISQIMGKASTSGSTTLASNTSSSGMQATNASGTTTDLGSTGGAIAGGLGGLLAGAGAGGKVLGGMGGIG